MAPLGRPRFAVLYLRGPISNPRILEQRYDTFFVMMLFYVDLSPKKLCSKHCFRRSARLGSLFSSPKLPIPLCLRSYICATMTIFLWKYLIHNNADQDFLINDIITKWQQDKGKNESRLKRLLKAIRFVNSVCTIFSLWKKGPPHQNFPS